MGKENKSYRIRTNVDKDSVVHFSVDNTIETFEILSLDIDQSNAYKLMGSDTGIIAGRVLANGGFGVPNVKVSVFIPYEDTASIEKKILYSYLSTNDVNNDGVRYNLLPDELDDDCHQNIGTFPSKRVLLDNSNWLEIFDKYYAFTTRTNNSGDYMIYGVPTGMQTVHMDVDMSDIGILSQRPRDLIYKGYNANMFESPNKFKVDKNIDSLAQVITQDQSVYVYPFWGDTTESSLNASITRCDMKINYKFEPTCIFMGSVITDSGENSMSQKCIGGKKQGRMDEMITGEGRIEMIRKTPNGQIEQFSIKGDSNINSDGVWCYQIPMNLDYVKTDEFGKMVMSDNPNTGLPTRARVRFRLSMSDTPSDVTARKRARFLIPNNPRLVEDDYPSFCESKEVDYEFGTKTKDENFRDLMWNNVYTVKSYIPRIQKSKLPNNLKHLGIKMVNHSGGNNPMPFNNLRIKFNFVYMFLCTLVKALVTVVRLVNSVLTWIGYFFFRVGEVCFNIAKKLNFPILKVYWFTKVAALFANKNGDGVKDEDNINVYDYLKLVYNDIKNESTVTGGLGSLFMRAFLRIGCGLKLSGLCENDDGVDISITPGTYDKAKDTLLKAGIESCEDRVDILYNCIENQLAQDNEVTSFNFYNDWINGVVYLPLWYRKIRIRRNGQVAKDKWCSTDNTIVHDRKFKKNIRVYATNTPKRVVMNSSGASMGTIKPLVNNENTVKAKGNNETGAEELSFSVLNDENCYGYQCHKYSRTYFKLYKGLIYEKETMLGDLVYYYKPCDYDPQTGNSDLVRLFATDIVLLGSLNSCDIHGVPQFFKCLESTTYNMPPDLLSETYDYVNEDSQMRSDEEDELEIDKGSRMTEYTGADWGNLGVDQSNSKENIITILGVTYSRDANENEYDNGGLFYGLTCFDSYTKPKSCINLSRICELGVSLDESQELPTSSDDSDTETDTATLTPDGFVSYDEIYNPDYRSMFATLNANFLKTKVNNETGLLEYDFNHLYIDNFDGSLKLLMMAKTVNGKTEKSDFTEKANYVGNYNMELSSDAYLNFRYGNYVKKNNNKIYFYENNNIVGRVPGSSTPIYGKDRLARYENSFYFYFGLNEGKTAIDKFNNEFYSDCTNKLASDVPYELTYQGNSWCPIDARDGFVAFNVNVELPVSVKFTDKDTNDTYVRQDINTDKILFGTKPDDEKYNKYKVFTLFKQVDNTTNEVVIMPSGTYRIEMTDGGDNVYEDMLTFELPHISFICDVNPFNCKNTELMEKFGDTTLYPTLKDKYTAIANYGGIVEYSRYPKGSVIRQGYTYYTLNGDVYNETVAQTTIEVDDTMEYYYHHEPMIDRDIYGFVAISSVNEDDFRLVLTPINETFFGNNYRGLSIDVHVVDGVPMVTENPVVDNNNTPGPGYLGYTISNDVITYYFGVPYGAQRYRFTLTQLCCEENEPCIESNNFTVLNVIVYEDEFKMYINNIDYDLISRFKTGWDDTKLEDGKFYKTMSYIAYADDETIQGGDIYYLLDNTNTYIPYVANNFRGTKTIAQFKAMMGIVDNMYKQTITSSYNSNDVVGWNNIFAIGSYNDIKHLNYTEPSAIVIQMANSLLSNPVGGEPTPYNWTDEFCYIMPDNLTPGINNGTIQKASYSYQILYKFVIADDVILHDYYGNVVDSNNIDITLTYYKDENATEVAVFGTDYSISNYNIVFLNGAVLYDYDGNLVSTSEVDVNETYYTDALHTTEAVFGTDYYYQFTIADGVVLYDDQGNIVIADDIRLGVDYYTDGQSTIIAVFGNDYTIATVVYDSTGNKVTADNFDRNNQYYTNKEHSVRAVVNVDYFEDVVYTTLAVTRVDSSTDYLQYSDNEYLYNGDVYYIKNSSQTYDKYVLSISQASIRISDLKLMIGETEIYYKLDEPEFSSVYLDNDNNTVATENTYGDIVYYKEPNQIESLYTNLICTSFIEYRGIIDDINNVLDIRWNQCCEVAAAFRINDSETMLTLTSVTKSRPVKYLIVGNNEIVSTSQLYNYKPLTIATVGLLNTNAAKINLNSISQDYEESRKIKLVSDGYVVDQNMDSSSTSFKLPTFTNGVYEEYNDSYLLYNGNEYYLSDNGSPIQKVVNDLVDGARITAGELKEKFGYSKVYKKISGTHQTMYQPYKDTADTYKHPYYVSIKNDNNSVLPNGHDTSNFDDYGTTKNLTTMFGVHFYNKPLTTRFSTILSYINDVPVYPKYRLGEEGYIGNLYNVIYSDYSYEPYDQFDGGYIEYTDQTEFIISNFPYFYEDDGVMVLDYVPDNIPDMGMSVMQLINYCGHSPIYHRNNTVVKKGELYYVYDNNEDKFTERVNNSNRSVTGILNIEHVDVIYYRNYHFDYSTSAIKDGDVYYEQTEWDTTPPPLSPTTVQVAHYDNDNLVYRTDFPSFQNIALNYISYDDDETILIMGTMCYYQDNNNDYVKYTVEYSDDNYYTTVGALKNKFNTDKIYYHILGGYRDLDTTPITVYLTTGSNQTYTYQSLPQIVHNNNTVKVIVMWYWVDDVTSLLDLTNDWTPVNVSMPGFVSGYLYNGIPYDEDASNIKAELNGDEIKYVTINSSNTFNPMAEYSDINVRRMIYTEYEPDVIPTYGVYTGVENYSPYKTYYLYQYIEIPLAESDLVYTDGYGDSYVKTINGTFKVYIDNTIMTYRRAGDYSEDGNPVYDDFLRLGHNYLNPDGYTEYQSIFYVFDVDKTPYPLEYSPDGTSNLKYDEVNQRFYFTTFPDFFLDMDNNHNWIIKTKSKSFDLTDYINKKYRYRQLLAKYPIDKFFVVGCCNGYYSISPIVETQKIRILYNYNNFNNQKGDSVYITARESRDKTSEDNMRAGIHYIEDLYYILNYSFTVHFRTFNTSTDDFDGDIYSQLCSIKDGTAKACYIKVTDAHDHKKEGAEYRRIGTTDTISQETYDNLSPIQKYLYVPNWVSVTYKATAIKIELSGLGNSVDDNSTRNTKIPDWYHSFIEDRSGMLRKGYAQTGDSVTIVEYDTYDDMINDTNSYTFGTFINT